AYIRNPRTFGTARLLLAVVAIDTMRNIIENFYFGLFFGAQYGLFPAAIIGVLGKPHLLIIPKVINVVAAIGVLALLLWRWLPQAARERADAEQATQEARNRLFDAIECVDESFALYDHNDRLIVCNKQYRELHPDVAALIVPGARLEDLVRAGL